MDVRRKRTTAPARQAMGIALSEPDAERLARLVSVAPAVAATALRATQLAGGAAETTHLDVEGVVRAVNGGALPPPEPEGHSGHRGHRVADDPNAPYPGGGQARDGHATETPQAPMPSMLSPAAVSAAEALRAARTAGIMVTLDGGALPLEAPAEPPQVVLDALSRHKLAMLDLLRPGQRGWTVEHWRAYFDKCRGIAASNHELTRSQADARALASCVVEWLNQHPAPSAPGRCTWCGPRNPQATRCSHSGPRGGRIHGCMPSVGAGGIKRGRPTRPRRLALWAFEHKDVAMSRKTPIADKNPTKFSGQ